MIGPEKGRYREKVERFVAAAQAAERERFASVWFPQVPNDFDALTAVALIGQATNASSSAPRSCRSRPGIPWRWRSRRCRRRRCARAA